MHNNNAGTGRVLQGSRQQMAQSPQQALSQTQMGMGQPQMGQPQQMNFLSQAIAMSKVKTQTGGQNASGGGLGFSYETSQAGLLGGVYNELRTELEVEQMVKQQAINTTVEVMRLVSFILNKRSEQGGHYSAFLSGIKNIVHPIRNQPKIDPVGEQVYNEIMSNNGVYYQVLSNTIVQVSGELVRLLVNGHNLKHDSSDVRDLVMDAAASCAHFVLIAWLYGHPNRNNLIAIMTQELRARLRKFEENYLFFKGRYEQLPGAEIPWGTGKVKEMFEGTQMNNELFDIPRYQIYNPNEQTLDFMAQAVPNDYINNQYIPSHKHHNQMSEMEQFIMNNVRRYTEQENQNQEIKQQELIKNWDKNFVSVNDYDRVAIPSKHFDFENRGEFRLADYFVHVGDDGWMIGHPQDVKNILTKLRNEERHPYNIFKSDLIGLNVSRLPVFKIDMLKGSAIVRFIHVPNANFGDENTMSFYLSNPSELLPYMFVQDGEVKTSWEPKIVETDKLVDEDNNFRPLDQMADQSVKPNILVGNKPLLSENDGDTIAKLDSLVKTYDPKEQLDAFILPVNMIGTVTMEEGINVETVHRAFPMLIKGNHLNYRDTKEMLMVVGSRVKEHFQNTRIEAMITTQLTNAVNRWLIECRGYAEKGDGNNWLVLKNIFDDINDFINYLNKNDPATLESFLSLNGNEFLISSFQFLQTLKESEEYFESKSDKTDPVSVALAKTQINTNLVIQREAVFVNLRKEIGPSQGCVTRIKMSQDPKIFAIVNEAIQRSKKHFKGIPAVMLRFEHPAGGYIREAVYSEFDNNVISLRSLDQFQGLLRGIPPSVI